MDELIKLDQVDEIAINLEPANEIDLDLGEVLGVVRPPELEKVEVTPTKETQVIKPSKFGTYIEEAKVYPIPDEYADITGVTASAEDVLNGKVFVDNQGNEVQGTAELKEDLDAELTAQDEAITRLTIAVDELPNEKDGGNYYLKVIDYDGTILDEKRLNNGDTYKLPNAPSHNGLVFQQWSCSQDIIDGVITIADNNVMVGATYTTASGLSEFDITLTKKTGLDVTLNMDGTKNWGDGTSDDLTTHTYTEYGDYTITCNGTTMTTSSNSGLFGQSSSARNYYCIGVRFGTSVTSIGDNAFAYCNSITNIVIPQGVTNIGSYVFTACYSLTNVIIPQGLTSIGSYVFQNCSLLKSVVITQSVTSIGTNTFQYCSLLKSVVIPQSVTTISNAIFQNCFSLTSIVIPQGVTSIGDNAFSYCYSLTSVAIPQSVTSIGKYAFQNCVALKNIVIPQGVARLSYSVFNYCYSLTSVVIPKSVTSIDYAAFGSCYNIIKYDFTQSTRVPSASYTNMFNGINERCKIYVPDSLYNSWIAWNVWSTYADYIYKASEMEVSNG